MTLSSKVRKIIQLHEPNHKYHNSQHPILHISMLGSVRKKERKKFFFPFLLPTYHSHLKLPKNATVFVLHHQVSIFPMRKEQNLPIWLNLLAQLSISLTSKVQESRSISVSKVFFLHWGSILCKFLPSEDWNDLKWTSISSICPFIRT